MATLIKESDQQAFGTWAKAGIKLISYDPQSTCEVKDDSIKGNILVAIFVGKLGLASAIEELKKYAPERQERVMMSLLQMNEIVLGELKMAFFVFYEHDPEAGIARLIEGAF